jgi:hypothetical protein
MAFIPPWLFKNDSPGLALYYIAARGFSPSTKIENKRLKGKNTGHTGFILPQWGHLISGSL